MLGAEERVTLEYRENEGSAEDSAIARQLHQAWLRFTTPAT